MIRRTLIAVALLAAGLTGPVTSSPSGAVAAAAPGACTNAEGVTIIISFHELRNHETVVYCAPDSPSTGLEALSQAGVAYQPTGRFPTFVCRIQGLPADDPCINPSPTHANWAYWIAPRGGDWCFTNLGAGGRRPPAGTVEGWAFSLNRTAQSVARPALPPPPPLAGVAPPPISAGQCAGASAPPAPTPRPSPPQPGPTPRPPATRPAAPAPPAGAGGAQPQAPGAGEGPGGEDPDASNDIGGQEGSGDPTGNADGSRPDGTDVDGGAAGEGSDDEDAGPDTESSDDSDERSTDDEAALEEWEEQATAAGGDGAVDDGDSENGSPWALIGAAVLVLGLGIGGYLRNRRTWTA